MNAEVTFDALEYQYGEGCPWNPAKHLLIPSCHWVKCIRAFATRNGFPGAERLFVYYHRWKGSFVLACWMIRPGCNKGPGLMRELEVLGGHPDRLEWDGHARRLPRLDYVMGLLKGTPEDIRLAKRRAISAYKDRVNARVETQEERGSLVKHLKRKMGDGDPYPFMLERGMIPFVGEHEAALNGDDGSALMQRAELAKQHFTFGE